MHTVHLNKVKVSEETQIAKTDLVCKGCQKIFTTKYNLDRHAKDNCQQIPLTIACDNCGQRFRCTQALANHKRMNRCRTNNIVNAENQGPTQVVNNGTIETQVVNANTNNNTINNTNNINIMVFPKDEMADFDFIVDHIHDALMKKYITQSQPSLGFEMFIDKVLEHPENQIAKKTNLQTKYSKIHTGNGRFEYASDSRVIPIITHHMTTAALQKVNEMRQKPIFNSIRERAKQFVNFIDEVNTNDESEKYFGILDAVKIILVNAFLRDKTD